MENFVLLRAGEARHGWRSSARGLGSSRCRGDVCAHHIGLVDRGVDDVVDWVLHGHVQERGSDSGGPAHGRILAGLLWNVLDCARFVRFLASPLLAPPSLSPPRLHLPRVHFKGVIGAAVFLWLGQFLLKLLFAAVVAFVVVVVFCVTARQ